MIYQYMASIGAMAVEEGGEMCIKCVKKSPEGETLEQNDGRTRGKHG